MHKHQQIAAQFLSEWFAEDETFAIVVRRPDEGRTLQRIICISDSLKSNYLGWLAFENSRGGNVYFSINPLTPGATRRTKDAVADAKGLYLDLDSEGDAKLATIRHSESVPVPSAVIQTSTGKYQVLWRIHGFSVSEQEETLKSLAETFGGDRACTDCARVFRLPGFFNRKYDPPYLVSVDADVTRTNYSPADFKLETPVPKTGNSAPIHSIFSRGSRTQSESDWRWVMAQLRACVPTDQVVRDLADSRQDKPNPLYYAQRTVDVASAVIWARNGLDKQTIVRRLTERSPTFANRNPAEIAATAFRFVERFRIQHSKEN